MLSSLSGPDIQTSSGLVNYGIDLKKGEGRREKGRGEEEDGEGRREEGGM